MRSKLALTIVFSTMLLGAKSCGPEFMPKLIEDPVLLNKPGTRASAFNQDMATTESTCFDQATSTTSHCYRVSAVIDPNNTFITRVVVQWGDRPGGNGEPWYDNAEPASIDFPNSSQTRPARWTARLPIRDNMPEGSVIDYQFRVFYRTSPESTTELSYWPGVRKLTIGPAQKSGVITIFGRTSSEPTSLVVQAGQTGTANIRLSRAPTAPVIVHLYSDAPNVVQAVDEAGQSISQLRFEKDQFVKPVRVKGLSSSSAVIGLWAKASGWQHDSLGVSVR